MFMRNLAQLFVIPLLLIITNPVLSEGSRQACRADFMVKLQQLAFSKIPAESRSYSLLMDLDLGHEVLEVVNRGKGERFAAKYGKRDALFVDRVSILQKWWEGKRTWEEVLGFLRQNRGDFYTIADVLRYYDLSTKQQDDIANLIVSNIGRPSAFHEITTGTVYQGKHFLDAIFSNDEFRKQQLSFAAQTAFLLSNEGDIASARKFMNILAQDVERESGALSEQEHFLLWQMAQQARAVELLAALKEKGWYPSPADPNLAGVMPEAPPLHSVVREVWKQHGKFTLQSFNDAPVHEQFMIFNVLMMDAIEERDEARFEELADVAFANPVLAREVGRIYAFWDNQTFIEQLERTQVTVRLASLKNNILYSQYKGKEVPPDYWETAFAWISTLEIFQPGREKKNHVSLVRADDLGHWIGEYARLYKGYCASAG